MNNTRIVTQQEQAESTARNWKGQYCFEGDWRRPGDLQIYDQLLALDPVTPEAVNAIIGNSAWTNLTCEICNEYVTQTLLLGECFDICPACLKEANDLFTNK